MPFRARKSITIIPGLVKLNLSGSTGRNGSKCGMSWTLGLLGIATYNTRDGKTRINTPGLGWWESSSRSQRQKRKLNKRVRKVQRAGGGTGRPGAGRKDAEAAHYARWFRALDREGGDPRAAALAAGRCPQCGHQMRKGQWCVPCAERAAKRHERAEERAAARGRHERRLYGDPTDPPPPAPVAPGARVVMNGPPHLAGLDAGEVEHGIDEGRYSLDPEVDAELARRGRPARSTIPYRDDVRAGRMSMIGAQRRRWLGEEETDQIETRERKQRQWQRTALENQGGTCGAKTKDGTKCRNGAGCAIPSHQGVLR